MRAPRPVQVLRGAQTHQMVLPVLDPVALARVLDETSSVDTAAGEAGLGEEGCGASIEEQQAGRIAELEATTRRLEGVVRQRESLHAEELRRIREDTTAQVRGEIAAAVQQWTSLVDRLVVEREQLYAEAEKDVLTLSMAIARRILGEAVQVDRQAVLTVVRRALDTVREQKSIEIHLHPKDLETAKEHESDWLKRAGTRQLNFQADPQLQQGDCWIHTESDDVDARIQQQLEAIREALVAESP